MPRPLRALVTAGGTCEPIDDVRVITNLSTGRFGAAIAGALARRGVAVTLLGSRALLAGRTPIDPRVRTQGFLSFSDLQQRLYEAIGDDPPDLLFMAAAVSDYAPRRTAGKLSSDAEVVTLDLTRNPKLLASLRERCGPDTMLIGFKLLSGVSRERLVEVARSQVVKNELDLCVGNDLACLSETAHPVVLVDRTSVVPLEGGRARVAAGIVERVLARRAPPAIVPLNAPDLLEEPLAGWDGLPGVERVVRVPGVALHPVVVDARAGRARLAVEAIEGRYRGGAFALALPGPWALLGLGRREMRAFVSDWTAAREVFLSELELQGMEVEAVPLLEHGKLVGVVGLDPAGTWAIPYLMPEDRGSGRGDAMLDRLDALGLDVRVTDDVTDYVVERGFRVVAEEEGWIRLEGPSRRSDLIDAASVFLFDPLERIVLLGKRHSPPYDGYWAFPGGKRNEGETLWETAVREMAEETGIDISKAEPEGTSQVCVATGDGTPAYRVTNFRVPVLVPPKPRATVEFVARWLTLEEAAEQRPMAAGTRRVLREQTPLPLPTTGEENLAR